eukprot:5665961-Lingulodinium_polyedra.AAC.1
MHDVTNRGFTESMMQEAIENWVSLQVMALDGRDITLDLTHLAQPELAIPTQPMAAAPRAIALLSLFD